MDLGHLILKLLNFDIYFLFCLFLYVVIFGGQNILSELRGKGAWPRSHLDPPLSRFVCSKAELYHPPTSPVPLKNAFSVVQELSLDSTASIVNTEH